MQSTRPFEIPTPPMASTRPMSMYRTRNEQAARRKEWVELLFELQQRTISILWWVSIAEFMVIMGLVGWIVTH